jgi:uncharacterized protein involved in tolerance to divalent cations
MNSGRACVVMTTISTREQAERLARIVLEARLVANHSYDTPEILQLPVEAGFGKYLGWMQKEVG